MKQKKDFSIPAVGAGSLLATFVVLCLTVFALMSLTTVQSEKRLADASNQAVASYYAADLQAEELFARLRAGDLPEEVTVKGRIHTYQCVISENQYLDVALEYSDGCWQILHWQSVTRENAGETDFLPVWQSAVKREETP